MQRISRQKDIKVDFTITINRHGSVALASMRRVRKHLLENGLKAGTEYFISDMDGKVTCWDYFKDAGGDYHLDCELTESETETGEDHYNELCFAKRGQKVTVEYYHESYRV